MSHRSHHTVLTTLLGATLALALVVLSPEGRSPVAARFTSHPAAAGLPVLTLSYYAGQSQLARTLDPAHIGVTTDEDMLLLIDAGLIHIGTDDKVEPDLASHWTVSNDHRTYTFYIRPNARFANGDYVTAGDVKFSIERALAPATGSQLKYYDQLIEGYQAFTSGKAHHLSGVKVINPRTVQIRITRPVAYFLTAFTDVVNDVLDPAVVRGKNASDTNNYLTNTCDANQGAGPFKLVCVNHSSSVTSFYPAGRTPRYTLVPNPYYYGPKPHLKLVLPAVGNPETAYNEYLAGQLDMVDIPADHVDRWRAHPAGQYHTATTSANYWLNLNTKMAPFDDVNCRLALAWGLDRNALATILHHTVSPLYTILPPGFPGYTPDPAAPHYSLQKAHAYFARCPGGKTPVTLKFVTPDVSHVSDALQAMMQAIGFHVTLKGLLANDWDTALVQPLSKTGTQLITGGWTQDYPDPQDYLSNLFNCGVGNNIFEWCDPAFDRLTQQADSTFKQEERYKLYAQAQHMVLSQAPVVPEYISLQVYLLKPWIHGLTRTSAYFDIMPVNLDWSQVTMSPH
jgi:oligopeptide transport system substrate-binding protein